MSYFFSYNKLIEYEQKEANRDNVIINIQEPDQPQQPEQSQQLQLEYKSTQNNTHHTAKQQQTPYSQYTKPDKQFRPIEDYKQTQQSNMIYNSNDIDIFRNKIDELLI